jgi:hypothetical protein
MNRSGASWSLTGAKAMLRLRALRASGDFDKYWEFHENQEYQRNHAANYADQIAPPPAPSSNTKLPPALKIVKTLGESQALSTTPNTSYSREIEEFK